jgi:hypothetical protein
LLQLTFLSLLLLRMQRLLLLRMQRLLLLRMQLQVSCQPLPLLVLTQLAQWQLLWMQQLLIRNPRSLSSLQNHLQNHLQSHLQNLLRSHMQMQLLMLEWTLS